jgi:hypothetical protein
MLSPEREYALFEDIDADGAFEGADLDFSRGPRGIEIRLRWPNGLRSGDLERLAGLCERYPDFSLALVGDEAIFRRT